MRLIQVGMMNMEMEHGMMVNIYLIAAFIILDYNLNVQKIRKNSLIAALMMMEIQSVRIIQIGMIYLGMGPGMTVKIGRIVALIMMEIKSVKFMIFGMTRMAMERMTMVVGMQI